MAPKKKGNLAHTKKAPSEIRATDSQAARTAIYLLPLYAVYMNRDCYVAIRTNGRLDFFDKKTKTEPVAKRRRELGRGHPRQSPERRAR